MYEDAQKIFDYLPIRLEIIEQDYINYLWETFSTLDNTDISARSFSVMPFHLLFMMVIQYKVIRISEHYQKCYNNFITENKYLKKENVNILLSQKKSVFDISSIRERSMGDILDVLTEDDFIKIYYKKLIDERNKDFAHANGRVEINVEEKIDRYINVLDSIQKSTINMNQSIADSLIVELKVQDIEDISNIMELYLFDCRSSPKDFGDIIHTLLSSEELDFDQWQQVVNKGLEISYDKTILSLLEISKNKQDEGKRFNVIRVLYENSEIDEGMKNDILKNENDQDIIELLNN